jgi:hypothetical protein
MSTRLNENLRGAIIANALAKAGLTQAQAELDKDRHIWTENTRIFINGATDTELAKCTRVIDAAYNTLPEAVRPPADKILAKQWYCYINLAGITAHLHFTDADGVNEYRIVPRNGRVTVPAEHALVKEFYDMGSKQDDIDKQTETLRLQVRAAISKVTTVDKLIKLWPEASELLPTDMASVVTNLPALAVADLNALIGLPSEAQAA